MWWLWVLILIAVSVSFWMLGLKHGYEQARTMFEEQIEILAQNITGE